MKDLMAIIQNVGPDAIVEKAMAELKTQAVATPPAEDVLGQTGKLDQFQCAALDFQVIVLHLKVNRDKTEVGTVNGMKFLGYGFYHKSGEK